MIEPERDAILLFVGDEVGPAIERMLTAHDKTVLCVRSVHEVAMLRQRNCNIQIAVLPDTLAGHDWWELWGELTLFDQRPEILVYSGTPTFQLWTGVLELGGADVISVPIEEEELTAAISAAFKSFKARSKGNESENLLGNGQGGR